MKYRYYSTQRPVTPGAYPKPKNNPAMLIHNFSSREYVPEIGRQAWGYVEYDKPLEKVRLLGRYQSREYDKEIAKYYTDGKEAYRETERRTAYELSVQLIEKMEAGNEK